jgi:hypothetical protein
VIVAPPEGAAARLLDAAGMRGRLTVVGDRDAAMALAQG